MGNEEEIQKLVVCSSRALPHLFTRIRDRNTAPQRFKFFAKRMMAILAEEVRDDCVLEGSSCFAMGHDILQQDTNFTRIRSESEHSVRKQTAPPERV